MNIIAADTSTQKLNVAIKKGTYFKEYSSNDNSMQHSQSLMPKIIELCSEAKLKTNEIDLFICTRGPGSFTGLRISMAALKGLAFGTEKDLVSVSTLLTYANMYDDYDGAVVTAIDAKKQRYYLAAFEIHNAKIKRLMQDTDGTVSDLEQVLSQYDKVMVIGPDSEAFSQILKLHYGETKKVETGNTSKKSFSESLIEIGLEQLKEKGPDDIGQGPSYLRKSDAEQALEDRLKKENSNG